MTYAFTQDVPIDAAFYGRIVDALGDDSPDGLITHLVLELDGGGLRYIDVWESETDWRRFVDERLHPALHELLRDIFGDDLPPEPEQHPLNLIHAWVPVDVR
jgi:hypothetical protein